MEILGIDEVGRGPWAGPLVVGACVLREPIEGLTDSKKLTKKRREELNKIILEKSACGLGWVHAVELDKIGLSAALKKAAIAAASQIKIPYHEIIIDGTINLLAETRKENYVTTLKKADLLIPAVSAASIIAKVARDNYMEEVAEKYPKYGFEKHVGYGTALHKQAIDSFGICPEHRKSFRPIAEAIGAKINKKDVITSCTTLTGVKAENIVAKHLESDGHEILARNWKTRMCEIDIVSKKADRIYFTEVKYRKNSNHGSGLEAITQEKIKRMKFAAECYLKCYNILNLSPLLSVADVAGSDFKLQNLLVLP